MNFQVELIEIKREIRDLKTAQTLPSWFSMNNANAPVPAGTYSGPHTWTIHYEDVGDTNTPITSVAYDTGTTLLPYDASTNTQKIEWSPIGTTVYVATTFHVASSRPIASITTDF